MSSTKSIFHFPLLSSRIFISTFGDHSLNNSPIENREPRVISFYVGSSICLIALVAVTGFPQLICYLLVLKDLQLVCYVALPQFENGRRRIYID